MARPLKVRRFAQVRQDLGAHMDADELLSRLAAPDARVEGTAFSGVELSEVVANGTAFDNVIFRNCTFEGVNLSNCTFTDVLFSGCRLVRCDMGRTWLDRCDFRSCSAPGLSFLKGRLTGVSFVDSQMGYCDLSEATVDRLVASETSLVEANLFSTKLRRAELVGCDLARATVFRTALEGIDLASCDISGLRVSGDFRELRGALVSPEQAVQLAGLLGVRVREDEWQ